MAGSTRATGVRLAWHAPRTRQMSLTPLAREGVR